MSKNTCITIDVSQGKSHIQAFKGPFNPYGKAILMKHTKEGYQLILDFITLTELEMKETPLVIFEYTGIYHKNLEKFLQSQKINYHIVAPLRAAKARNNEIRVQKTDARDCLSLSKLFYNNNLGIFKPEEKVYAQMRKFNRYYETCMVHLIKTKVNFKETLAIIYPNYKELFDFAYTNESLAFLKLFPHPSAFLALNEENQFEFLKDKWNHKDSWLKTKLTNIRKLIKNIVSGCNNDDPEVSILLSYINQIEYYQSEIDKTLEKLVELNKDNKLYEVILSLPGVQENLASRTVAELGDINRFTNYKAITAYAGIDPMIRQSGDKDGTHLSISKKGNPNLRKLLYLMAHSMIQKNRADNAIRDNYIKKTQRTKPLNSNVAYTACANQLIRIIYYMHKTSSVYTYK